MPLHSDCQGEGDRSEDRRRAEGSPGDAFQYPGRAPLRGPDGAFPSATPPRILILSTCDLYIVIRWRLNPNCRLRKSARRTPASWRRSRTWSRRANGPSRATRRSLATSRSCKSFLLSPRHRIIKTSSYTYTFRACVYAILSWLGGVVRKRPSFFRSASITSFQQTGSNTYG